MAEVRWSYDQRGRAIQPVGSMRPANRSGEADDTSTAASAGTSAPAASQSDQSDQISAACAAFGVAVTRVMQWERVSDVGEVDTAISEFEAWPGALLLRWSP